MGKFAAGVMDIMHNVFGLEEELLLCAAEPKIGRMLLDEIMTGGNFGHYDERNAVAMDDSSNPIKRVVLGLKWNWRFRSLGMAEILCSPFCRLWHFCWMNENGYR